MFATHHYETILSNTFRNVSAVGVTNLFLGLYLTNPTNYGNSGIEVSYQTYARQPLQFITPYTDGDRVGVRNAENISFPVSPAHAGEAAFFGISDSPIPGSGNMFLFGEWTVPLEIRANQQPSVAAGALRFFILGDHTRAWKTAALNVLRGETFSGFESHVALFNNDPEQGGTELSGEGYARAPVNFSTPAIQTGGNTKIFSTEMVEFPEALSMWGTWAWTGIMPGPTGGLPMFAMPKDGTPEVMHPNYQPFFNVGSIAIGLD